jgi:competence protein ComGC
LRKTIDELESTYNGTVDKYEDQLKIERNKTLIANMMFILLLVTFILLVVMYVLIKKKSKLPI